MAKALVQGSDALSRLDLSRTACGGAGAARLWTSLRANASVTDLCFSGARGRSRNHTPHRQRSRVLLRRFSRPCRPTPPPNGHSPLRNPSARPPVLGRAGNKLSDHAGSVELGLCVRGNATLVSLDVSDSELEEAHVGQLARALLENKARGFKMKTTNDNSVALASRDCCMGF